MLFFLILWKNYKIKEGVEELEFAVIQGESWIPLNINVSFFYFTLKHNNRSWPMFVF